MRVFVAGASGTLGRPLLRASLERGHEVIGLTRSQERRASIEAAGARAAVADALDFNALNAAMGAAAPTHVVHLLTALPPGGALRERDLRATNRVRRLGTRNLLRAAIAAGARRIVAESFMGVYGPVPPISADGRSVLLDELAPLPEPGPGPLRDTVLALREMEEQLRAAAQEGAIETVTLRYGGFYGPGVPTLEGTIRRIRAGRLFAPPPSEGVLSFVHIDDAVAATVAALEHTAPGRLYNICDDKPVGFDEFLRLSAAAFGGRPPRRLPRWIVRLAAPVPAAAASWRLALANARAKRELGWLPKHTTPEDGLRQTAAVVSRLEAAA